MEFIDPKKKNKSPKFFEEGEKKVETIYDDPEWQHLSNKVKKRSKKEDAFDNPVQEKEKEQVEVNIKLSLPKAHIKLAKKLKGATRNFKDKNSWKQIKAYRKQPKTYLIFGGIVMLIGAVSLMSIYKKDKDNNLSTGGNQGTAQIKEEPVSHDPPFSPVLPPSGIEKEEISYNPERNFAKFDDSIDGIFVSVSQQSMPDDFKNDTENKLTELTKGFQAEKTIQTGSGLAYIKETEQGPETIIFSKFGMLIFIRTGDKVSDRSTIDYIDNLN